MFQGQRSQAVWSSESFQVPILSVNTMLKHRFTRSQRETADVSVWPLQSASSRFITVALQEMIISQCCCHFLVVPNTSILAQLRCRRVFLAPMRMVAMLAMTPFLLTSSALMMCFPFVIYRHFSLFHSLRCCTCPPSAGRTLQSSSHRCCCMLTISGTWSSR